MKDLGQRPDYPKRPPFYAHKFVRLLTKSCATQDIGRDACLLLCYIAHQEDAVHYRKPVKFWNVNLMHVMGFNSPKQLNNCREAAIKGGWLVYWRGGNRELGEYFVTVPPHVESLTDTAIETEADTISTPIHSAGGTISGMIPGTISGTSDGTISGTVPGTIGGTESGKPSIPSPDPSPFRCLVGSEVKIPEKCSNEITEEAVTRWVAYLTARDAEKNTRDAPKADSAEMQTLLMVAARYAPEQFTEIVTDTIAGRKNRLLLNVRASTPTAASDEWQRALMVLRQHHLPNKTSAAARKAALPEDVYKACATVGIVRIAQADQYSEGKIRESFEFVLQEIRNGNVTT